MGEIRVAEASREQLVQVAENLKLQRIGVQTADKEQAVRIADLAKEKAVGEQSAAFLRDAQVKEAEQQMRIAVADADSRAIDGENTAAATIAQSNAELKVKQAEAYQLGETRKRVAAAAVIEEENRALAKAAEAEAEKVEQERRAALEAPARAEKAQTIVEAEAEREKLRIEAEGEAAAIFAKLEAEAKGNYEILAKKGEGLHEIVKACGGADAAFKLLMLEHMDTLAETSAQAISNIKFDKIVVWENGGNGNGKGSTADFLNGLTNTLPPMMQVMKEVGGVEFPEYLAKFTQEEEANGAPAAEEAAVATSSTKAGGALPEAEASEEGKLDK